MTQLSKLRPIELGQVAFSLACLTCAALSVAMSVKQWSSYDPGSRELSYSEILALREDTWLGISREADAIVTLLALQLFVPVVVLSFLRRTAFHYIASAVCGLGLITAGIAWFAPWLIG